MNSNYILTPAKLTEAISTYGGIYFSGFGSPTSGAIRTITVKKSSLSTPNTADDGPYAVKNNVIDYFENNLFTSSTPTAFDLLSADVYVTSTDAQLTTTVQYLTSSTYKQTGQADYCDAPAASRITGDKTAYEFFDDFDCSADTYNNINIITFDNFDIDKSLNTMYVNFDKYIAVD